MPKLECYNPNCPYRGPIIRLATKERVRHKQWYAQNKETKKARSRLVAKYGAEKNWPREAQEAMLQLRGWIRNA